jgi:hypothetical protein
MSCGPALGEKQISVTPCRFEYGPSTNSNSFLLIIAIRALPVPGIPPTDEFHIKPVDEELINSG